MVEGPAPPKTMSTNRIKCKRHEEILIRPTERKRYAEVLRSIKGKVKPDKLNVAISSIRETRQGDVLVELGKAVENKEIFEEALRRAIGDACNVRGLALRPKIEFQDLDSTAIRIQRGAFHNKCH